jgi:hypothetical protein
MGAGKSRAGLSCSKRRPAILILKPSAAHIMGLYGRFSRRPDQEARRSRSAEGTRPHFRHVDDAVSTKAGDSLKLFWRRGPQGSNLYAPLSSPPGPARYGESAEKRVCAICGPGWTRWTRRMGLAAIIARILQNLPSGRKTRPDHLKSPAPYIRATF